MLNSNNSVNTATPLHHLAKDKALVIFIVGPYASKWFANQPVNPDDSSDNQTLWITVKDNNDLKKWQKEIDRLRVTRQVMAFLPFLPDGQETEEKMLSAIDKWQSSLQLSLKAPLPCLFALYAQLSLERSEDDPDRAIWTGNFSLSQTQETTLEVEFTTIINDLEARHNAGIHHAIQRYTMACSTLQWARETGVLPSLQRLFSTTCLKLTGVLLSDYGAGFARHGALASWLATKYAIYPGLSASVALPPLPDIEHTHSLNYFISDEKKIRNRWLWWPVILTIFFALSLTAITWEQSRLVSQAERNIKHFEDVDFFRIQAKRNAYKQLVISSERVDRCDNYLLSRLWGLDKCRQSWLKLKKIESDYNHSPYVVSSGSAALFEQGSARLKFDSDRQLKALLDIVKKNPNIHFLITGHTDNTGTEKFNKSLSEMRAKTVRDWLVKHTDIPVTHFSITGAGFSVPVASNDTEEGRQQNRRVDITPAL